MSRENVRVHYDILTKKYFKKYEETGDLFQKAGAVLHNQYYWPMMRAYDNKNKPSKTLMERIETTHGDFKKFKAEVVEKALSLQGSGWALIMEDLQIQIIQNHVIKPGIVLAIDLWEHQTVDYEFDRVPFLGEFWNVVDWTKLETGLVAPL
jgi:Fe-Mn family superoxide dismutase